MNSSIYKFTLDLHRNQSQISIPVMQNDTARIFNIALSERGKPYRIADGCLAMISIKRPTGTYIEAFCSIVDNTYIKYDFGENEDTAVVEGLHNCQVSVFDADGDFISSAKFTMVVHSRAVTSDDIEISDTDRGIIDSIVIQEAGRVDAESERINAENLRIEAENSRNTAEIERENSTSAAIESCNNASDRANEISEELENKLANGEFDGDVTAMIVTLSDVTVYEETDTETTYTYSAISHTYDEILEHINNGGVAYVEYEYISGFFTYKERIPYGGILFKSIIQFYREYKNSCTIIEIAKGDNAETGENGVTAASLRTIKNKTVLYEAQTLTDEQKAQARANIGAVSADEISSNDGTTLPEVGEIDNGKIAMVVNGAWAIVDCPTGTQYDVQTFTLAASSWYTDGDYVRCDIEYEYINTEADLIIDVSVAPNIDMMAEAGRCGVFCSGQEAQILMFHAYETPDIDIDVVVRITKPKGLSYTVDEENMTITIAEG